MRMINDNQLEKKSNINFKFIGIILVVLVVLFLIGWWIFTFPVKDVSCGDGICDKNETWEECPEDCKVVQIEEIEEKFASCKKDADKICLAIVDKDIDYCDSIDSEIMRNSCLVKTIFMFDIFENKDESSCSKIEKVDINECLNIVDSIKVVNIEKCQSELCRDVLILYLAGLEGDVNLCKDIIDENIRIDCKLYLTSNMDYCDYSYCSDIYNIHMREYSDDESYCDNVISSSGKQSCLEYKNT